MFTGIIRHVGKVVAVRSSSAGGKTLAIDLGPLAKGLGLGESIAVSGACLTATAIDGNIGQFDVIAETVARTTLGGLRAGSAVNLEPALRADQGLDGHIVQGHVDGIAHLRAIRKGGQYALEFTAGPDLTSLMVAKGSVAIDGVSLTIVEAGGDFFSVALIPTTLRETTLGLLQSGSPVNIETDIIGRYIRKFLGAPPADSASKPAGLTMEKLREAGFI